MKFKSNSAKILGLAASGLGLVVTLISSKAEDANRKEMKAELKEEILKELSNSLKKQN